MASSKYQPAPGWLLRGVTTTQVEAMSERAAQAEPAADGAVAADEPARIWADAAACFRAWCDGDPAGLDGLVRVMTPVLWHVVRSYRLPQDAAEDVIQSTWLALVRRRDAIEDSGAVGGWLTTTARREAWRVSRSSGRATPVEDTEISYRLPAADSAEASALARDEQTRLWRAVGTLPERCQRLLRIVAFEHRPDYGRVASELGMPVGSIGPTRGRCLAKLKAALAAVAFTGEVTS